MREADGLFSRHQVCGEGDIARAFHAFHDSHTSITKFNTIHGKFAQLFVPPVRRTKMLGIK
jgi:hypothetical protein